MGNSSKRIVLYIRSCLHHEAEEGGKAVQGGVEELSTGLVIYNLMPVSNIRN